MRYYNLPRNWTKYVQPHLADPVVQDTLVGDFNRFTYGKWRKQFLPGMVPHDFENCDWWLFHRGPLPRYWLYTKHSACHWLCNFNLELAVRTAPRAIWRIVTSDQHSTVWNGADLLFDTNFMAFGVSPDEAWELASTDGEVLEPGEHVPLAFAPHYTLGN